MKKIRIGKDILLRWNLGQDLSGRELTLEVKQPYRVTILPHEVAGSVITAVWHGTDHHHCGPITLTLWENYGELNQAVADVVRAFALVPSTADESDADTGALTLSTVTLGGSYDPGDCPADVFATAGEADAAIAAAFATFTS